MNIRQLKQFAAVAESGSISRSAKDLNISQPALTRSLKNLEESLGVELIGRRANGVFLTPYGEHLLDYANCIVGDSERVRREINAIKMGRRGQISIGVGPAFCGELLPSVVDRLLLDSSQLDVRLVEGFIEDLCGQLRAGTLDVVLSLFPANFDVSDLSFSQLSEVESLVVASASHPLATKKNVTRRQLASCNWVIADQKYAMSTFREYLSREEIPSSAHHLRVNSLRVIKSMVFESNYLAILPKMLIQEELNTGQLAVIDGPAKAMVTVGGIVCRNSGFKSAALREFINIVKDEFGSDPSRPQRSQPKVRPLF